MNKSKFNLSYLNSTTFNMGNLVPFCLIDCLPNDSLKLSVKSVIRAQPMLAPLMHKVNIYTQYWFVPYRLLWDNWESFITGGADGNNTPAFPYVKLNYNDVKTGSLADYFGFPKEKDVEVSAMPFRALALIWNDRYRDEDIQKEVALSFADGEDTITSRSLLSPCWKKNYFSVARTTTQRGNEISVPVGSASGGSFNGYAANYLEQTLSFAAVSDIPTQLSLGADMEVLDWDFTARYDSASDKFVYLVSATITDGLETEHLTFTCNSVALGNAKKTTAISTSPYVVNLPNPSIHMEWGTSFVQDVDDIKLVFDVVFHNTNTFNPVESKVADTGQLDIRSLRLASALQRYQERSLLFGNRYEEFIQREFGIRPRDSRIQRPEYLGGSKSLLQISEVLQTAEGTNTGVGTMRGHGIGGTSQRPIRVTVPEHGIIIGLLSLRPEPVYTQGVERAWLKRSRLDFFTPELANVGLQEVFQQEIYANKDNKGVVFGYSDKYSEYRKSWDKVTGEFRDTLNYWNLAIKYSAPPVISDGFLNMGNALESFKRPFASQSTHQFLAMILNDIKAYRRVPKIARNILK